MSDWEYSNIPLAPAVEGARGRMKKYFYLAAMIAWVLWIRTQSTKGDSWNALPGFQNREQCAANMKDKLAVWRGFKEAIVGEDTVKFTGSNTTISYICLSEDEDPRRKAKPVAPKQPVS